MAACRASPERSRRGSLVSNKKRAWATDDGLMVSPRLTSGWLSMPAQISPPAASTSSSNVPASQARRRPTVDALNALFQAGRDEVIEVAVEHALGVAGFEVGPQILDARLVEHVRTDLVTPADVGFGIF